MKRPLIRGVAIFLIGVIVGGVIFSSSQRRSLLTVPTCEECLSPAAFLGLVGSVVVLKTPGLIPNNVYETDRMLAFAHPKPSYPKHFVFVPKKDIKAIGDLAVGDERYVAELLDAMGTVIREQKMTEYTIWSNGPGMQTVEYLHYHVGGK
ncbi:MAG: HIT domain-containing protein [Planctomycetaceae bacterium]